MARSATFSDLSYDVVSRVQLVISEGTDVLTYAFSENYQFFCEGIKLLHIAMFEKRIVVMARYILLDNY